MNSNKYSEETMSINFEEYIKHKFKNSFLNFNHIFKEIECKQGIPDFIGISGSPSCFNEESKFNQEVTESSSIILSLLKQKAPRTEKYLIQNSGINKNRVKKTIKHLSDINAISMSDSGSYTINSEWLFDDIEIWAFELKLNNWKRAIFQACQYKAFADRVILVFPYQKKELISSKKEIFKEMKIGVFLFNPFNHHFEIVINPPKNKKPLKHHKYYAIKKMLNRINEHSNN